MNAIARASRTNNDHMATTDRGSTRSRVRAWGTIRCDRDIGESSIWIAGRPCTLSGGRGGVTGWAGATARNEGGGGGLGPRATWTGASATGQEFSTVAVTTSEFGAGAAMLSGIVAFIGG